MGNGCFATIVHYGFLEFNLNVLMLSTIAFANVIACCFGILVSFLGNKYIVFKSISGSFSGQLFHFFLFYCFVAIFHGTFIYIWADFNGYNYRIGFLIATALQVLITYNYNKILIFKK
jgi:putative flippase GtrA